MPKDTEPRPIISGHCAWPQTKNPEESHQRCPVVQQGHPCSCPCHLKRDPESEMTANRDGTYGALDVYVCGGCGGRIVEVPALGLDSDGDPIYGHIDPKTERLLYLACR